MIGWQPIETAPDAMMGEHILVVDKWGLVEVRLADGGFWRHEKRESPDTFYLTHWMPLPNPPNDLPSPPDKYCKGKDAYIKITLVESKAWHDDDLYQIVCLRCGKTETQLARRSTDTIMLCGKKE